MFQVKKKSTFIFTFSNFSLLIYIEIYRRILENINLFHLIGFDAPPCSIILLMHTSNLFLQKPSDTEKRWCALFTSSE